MEVAVPAQQNTGYRLTTWVALTLVSISTMLGTAAYFSPDLQEWGQALAVKMYQETLNAAIQFGWDLTVKAGAEAAKDFADDLIDSMQESVGKFANLPEATRQAVQTMHMVEFGVSVLLGLGAEYWCEKFRKKGNFSFVRASVYSAGIYGSSVGLRTVLLTQQVFNIGASMDQQIVDWWAVKEMVHGLIDAVVPEADKEPKNKKKRDIRDYGEEIP